jgi:predicted RNA-binding Zn ribbon-like protein
MSHYAGVVDRSSRSDVTPPDLVAVEEFLNTVDERSFSRLGVRHSGGDALGTSSALTAWLADHGMLPAGAQAIPEDLAIGLALRDALRGALLLRAGGADHGTAGRANATLAALPLRVELDADGTPRLTAVGDGVRAALAGLASTIARSQAAGTWRRMRICAAADCRWVFYDGSRSGAGRWCSMATCGNRNKTRAYRRRHPTSLSR